MAIFELKSDLPLKTQEKIDYLEAIDSAKRTTAQAAFLTALTPYLTNAVLSVDASGNIVAASGLTVPTGYSGFAKNATFVKTDATANGLYTNTGTTSVAAWDLVDQASTSNITDGAVTMAKLADIATKTFIGRVAAGTGVPKACSVAEVKTALGLDETILITGTPVNAVASVGTLTVTAGGNDIADGMTVSIGGITYTFKTALTPTEGEVLIGANDTATLLNLKNALNHAGTPGTDYSVAAANPSVVGTSSNATTLVITAKVKGTVGNAITFTKSGASLSVDGAGFVGGTVVGVNGSVGSQWEVFVDSSYLYVAIAANTTADANWRRISLGTAY